MPIVEMTILEGRSFEKKKAMVEAVTDAIVTSFDAPRDSVRIIIREVPPWHFAAGGVLKGEPK